MFAPERVRIPAPALVSATVPLMSEATVTVPASLSVKACDVLLLVNVLPALPVSEATVCAKPAMSNVPAEPRASVVVVGKASVTPLEILPAVMVVVPV